MTVFEANIFHLQEKNNFKFTFKINSSLKIEYVCPEYIRLRKKSDKSLAKSFLTVKVVKKTLKKGYYS